ncbi:BMC domain-containing protein [Virgibacillus oceani]|uniref:Carboxysome shell protein n=1 Tax=Virgibacillus oceani TaxID=1479511 RepID=A0A917M5C3_9BACI|nr:BMC domain-containing protein [Virgibacillus oceani]GGG79943.1 carboxysome shell protein [Virgibacillus oceani]
MVRALGMVETKGLATSIEVADAMLKNSHVSLVNQANVGGSLVTIFIEGNVSAVQNAVETGKAVAQQTGALLGCDVIPHPDASIKRLFR